MSFEQVIKWCEERNLLFSVTNDSFGDNKLMLRIYQRSNAIPQPTYKPAVINAEIGANDLDMLVSYFNVNRAGIPAKVEGWQAEMLKGKAVSEDIKGSTEEENAKPE